MYYVIQFGESSAELIRAVAGDVDCSSRPCGLGKALPVLTSPSSENIITKSRHPLKIAFLSILPTNEEQPGEIWGRIVDCCPSPPTLALTHLTVSQARNWLAAFLCSPWVRARPSPYIGQVDAGMSSEVTGPEKGGDFPKVIWLLNVRARTLKSLDFFLLLLFIT